MPSWRESMSDSQIWNVVAWLEASAKPPQTYVQWHSQRRCGTLSACLSQLDDRLPFFVAHRGDRQPRLADQLHLGELRLGLDLLERHRAERPHRLDRD